MSKSQTSRRLAISILGWTFATPHALFGVVINNAREDTHVILSAREDTGRPRNLTHVRRCAKSCLFAAIAKTATIVAEMLRRTRTPRANVRTWARGDGESVQEL